MLSQIKTVARYLRARLSHLLDLDQRGIETLEWILIGALVTGAAIIIYGTLETGLNTAVNTITNTINQEAQP